MYAGSSKAEWVTKALVRLLPHLGELDVVLKEPDEACARGAGMLGYQYGNDIASNFSDSTALEVAVAVTRRCVAIAVRGTLRRCNTVTVHMCTCRKGGETSLDCVIRANTPLPAAVKVEYTVPEDADVILLEVYESPNARLHPRTTDPRNTVVGRVEIQARL